MNLTFEHRNKRYRTVGDDRHLLSIPMQFDGPQPNHFGAAPAHSDVLHLGSFVGDTKQGGSCNVDTLRMTPHCNGTHTETITHIVDEHIWVGHAATEVLGLAVLITVQIVPAATSTESYRPALKANDKLISAASLRHSFAPFRQLNPTAVVVRTQPNDTTKRARAYSADNEPAFMTIDAMRLVNDWGCRHLLVDVPSVDRMYDDGLLTNHHIFWNVPEETHSVTPESWQDKTITEMVFVEDSIPDGIYLLNLQIPDFCSDAAPSRPVLLPVKHDE